MSNVINTHSTNLRDEIQSVDLDTPELGDDYAIQDTNSGVIILMASHVDLEK